MQIDRGGLIAALPGLGLASPVRAQQSPGLQLTLHLASHRVAPRQNLAFYLTLRADYPCAIWTSNDFAADGFTMTVIDPEGAGLRPGIVKGSSGAPGVRRLGGISRHETLIGREAFLRKGSHFVSVAFTPPDLARLEERARRSALQAQLVQYRDLLLTSGDGPGVRSEAVQVVVV